ncbi:MAG TPA: DUF3048 domain-containing protein [Jatrophihabitans sp.]|nr:DUF3048 domain-containing protein [Jatrophihabitans sp.]
MMSGAQSISGRRRNPVRTAGGIVLAVAVGTSLLAGCGGAKKKAAAPTVTPSSSSVSASPTPAPTTARPMARLNPLTGVGPAPAGPVLAVKIDDTANGRPSRGIDQADVLYIEQAEGGLTRMVAVFGTHKPVVEAVRSVRASDAELLEQYGPITLVASGGGGDSLTTLDRSIVKGVINDRGGPGFSRDANRPAPYNLQSNLAQVAAAVNTGGSKPIGFTFARTDPQLAHAAAAPAVNTVVGSTAVSFAWEPTIGKYVRTIGGQHLAAADGALVASPNVLVQLCQVSVNPNDVDVEGNPSQFTHSVGSGTVVLFRNGKRITGRWKRANAASGTTFTDLSGKPLLMAPGGAIVVLATVGAPV